jgi:hypothetical protein
MSYVIASVASLPRNDTASYAGMTENSPTAQLTTFIAKRAKLQEFHIGNKRAVIKRLGISTT